MTCDELTRFAPTLRRGVVPTRHWSLVTRHFLISGYELWKIDNDGLIGESKGHFDSAEYERQLKHGVT